MAFLKSTHYKLTTRSNILTFQIQTMDRQTKTLVLLVSGRILLFSTDKTQKRPIQVSDLRKSVLIKMFDFTNNYFLSPKRTIQGVSATTPRSKALARNNVSVGLLLANILKIKITKQLEQGFGKIMIEGLPRVSFNKFELFNNDNESSYFSTTMCTPESTPKNSFRINKQENMLKAANSRLLKKRSSLNETRAVINSIIEKQSSPSINPERTYAPSNKELTKQLEGFKMMRLSCDVRTILEKVVTFDKKNFAYELEKLCKDQFSKQIRKLERVKNSSKELRSEVFDNQLTMAVLNTNIKMISDINKELQEIKKSHVENERQLRMKKEQNERVSRSTQKLEKHLGNIESEMKKFTDRIEEQLNRKELGKALIGINEFMKKYENQEYAKEKVYFYNLLKERINDYREIEKCLDEVCRILGVLGIADFNHTDACIRSLTSNSSAFKYIKRVYGNIDKFYGKQMTNIIHNLEKFNNNIVMYLEATKEVDRQMNKPTGIEELKKEHSLEIANLNTRIQEQKRKIALLQMELEKKNYKINNMNPLISDNQNAKKIQNEFERRLNDILNKIASGKDFNNELQAFRKSPILSVEKPYSQFINLTFALQRRYDENIKSEIQSLSGMFDEISKVFKKSSISQEAKFKELHKLLNTSGRKNVFYFDLHRFLQSLMFTIVHKTKTKEVSKQNPGGDLPILKNTKAQSTIFVPLEKKRSRRFSENFEDLRFDGTVRQEKSCMDNYHAPKSIGFYDQKEQDLGDYNEKELLNQMELFLNKVSPILHKPNVKMEDKLEEVENLAEKFIVNNYKYKDIFSSLENWISFAASRLELKGAH